MMTPNAQHASPGTTLYTFRLLLDWKGRTGDITITGTNIDDVESYWDRHAKSVAGFPRTAYVRKNYLGTSLR